MTRAGAAGDLSDVQRGLVTGRRPCPLCGELRRSLLLDLPAASFCSVNSTYRGNFDEILGIDRGERYSIVRCDSCGFTYAGDVPEPEFLKKVYERVIDFRRAEDESLSPGWVAHQFELASNLIRALVESFGEAGELKILDFGCGFGTLLRAFQNSRIHCWGYETSESRLNLLRNGGLRALSTIEEVESEAPYHGIILSDVLEHVVSPRQTVRMCGAFLRRSGLLLASVPDFGPTRLRQIVKSALEGTIETRELNPWEHLNYFSPDTLRSMFEREGFDIQELPGPVDVGLRPGLRGRRRLKNCLASGLRLARYALGRPLSRTVQLAAFHRHPAS